MPFKVERPPVDQGTIEEVFGEIRAHLERKIAKKGPGIYVGAHEAAGIIQEEVDEYWKEVHKNNEPERLAEALDIITGCIWDIASTKTRQRL